jgi:hypothetical protein
MSHRIQTPNRVQLGIVEVARPPSPPSPPSPQPLQEESDEKGVGDIESGDVEVSKSTPVTVAAKPKKIKKYGTLSKDDPMILQMRHAHQARKLDA